MMPEWVHQTADAPAVFFAHGVNLRRSGLKRTFKHVVRVWNRQYHAN